MHRVASVMHFLLILAVVMGQSVMAADAESASNEQSAIVEEAIRKSIKKTANELTKADLKKVTKLNLDVSSANRFRSGARIKETGLEEVAKLTQLESLRLHGNQLTEVTSLAKLTQLTYLHLGNNRLTDLSPLAKLTQLKTLHLSYNLLTDASPLAKLTQLEYLHLNGNQFAEVSALVGLTKLKTLILSDNKFTAVSALAKPLMKW